MGSANMKGLVLSCRAATANSDLKIEISGVDPLLPFETVLCGVLISSSASPPRPALL